MSQIYLKSEDRKSVTVESVVELAAEKNPSEITTAQIAKHMGVTQGALFRHFPNKDAIWESVMSWVAEKLLGRVESVAAREVSAIKALEAMFITHINFVAEHPGVPRMLFGELQNQAETPAKKIVRNLLSRYGVVIETQLKRGQAMGEIDPQLDPAVAAGLFVGSIQGLVMQSMLAGTPATIVDHAPKTFAIFERGIRANTGDSP